MVLQKKKYLLYSLFCAGILLLSSGKIQAQTPGGVTNTNYTWVAWLTADDYNNGTWKNKITDNGSAGNFSSVNQKGNTSKLVPPALVATGYNFNPSVKFTKGNSSGSSNDESRLVSANVVNFTNKNATAIFVFKRNNKTNYENLFTFNANNDGNIGWYTNNSQDIRWYWNANNTSAVVTASEGMITFDNPNTTTAGNGLNTYSNGGAVTTNLAKGVRTYNSQLAIATNGSSGYGFNGTIQEIIVLSAGASGSHLDANDLRKIHSYLAIKYGITLSGGANYVSSDGTVVWDTSANVKYGKNVFGIGRDDASGLYQKQSHSVESRAFSVYVGNSLQLLNSQNDGTLADKQYLMIGSNGANPISPLTGIKDGDNYMNGNVESSTGFDIQSPVYKAKLTGAQSMKVNFQAPSNDFSYVLVSTEPGFTPSNTRIYPIDQRIAEVEIDQYFQFFKFIGFAPGPGGVNGGLRLWLRADNDATLDIEYFSKSSIFNDYHGVVKDTANVPAVSAWSDPIRGHIYSYDAGPSEDRHLFPVFKANSPELNYHPAVHFWGSGTKGTGSYLSNPEGIMSSAIPEGGKHSAFFLVNNDFGRKDWIYMLGFKDTKVPGEIPSTAYGVQRRDNGNKTVGRFRTNVGPARGDVDLFDAGSTSILGYKTNTHESGNNNPVQFRFNAQEDNTTTISWGSTDMTSASTLGSAYALDRTVQGVMSEVIFFERELALWETERIESYMALKYGITLYPSTNASNRFTYKFSDGSIVWEGNTASGKFVTFYNNIAAVIRDDAAHLNNSHAHSTNVGSLLHIGVAGKALSEDGSAVSSLENNMEAIVFGNDGGMGNVKISADHCGDFDYIFKRKWLVHKITKDDRPIALLVGAQNNMALTIGSDSVVIEDYYTKLHKGNNVSLIVADSPADIDNGNYRAVIPMSYINGEHQCNYVFSEIDTYITFGWKPNDEGCTGDENTAFEDVKTFKWTQWNYQTNNSNTAGATFSINTSVDLGDNIAVTGTSVKYGAGIKPVRGYPRSVNLPVEGSLGIYRSGGGPANQDITVTVAFDSPVIPEFTISALDGYRNSYEEVEIYGTCEGSTFVPVLRYASDPKKASYRIAGNKATVNKRVSIPSGSNKNGMVHVSFKGGITALTIKYRIKGITTGAARHIVISPITMRPVPPPPPINEDGLSFVKQVKNRNITTCEPVEYSFYIQNTNCAPKYVTFSDILPEYMTWQAESVGFGEGTPSLKANDYGNSNVLRIDSLLVQGSSTLVVTATALLDKNAPDNYYSNRAHITYQQTVSGKSEARALSSVDRETLEPNTVFYATWAQRKEPILMEAKYKPEEYKANDEIEVSYTIANPNAEIANVYLDINFNEEFMYVDKSFRMQLLTGSSAKPGALVSPYVPGTLNVAGTADGSSGFTIAPGFTSIKFKLKAPATADIPVEWDDNGKPTEKKAALDIIYGFSSEADDPCTNMAIKNLQGNRLIPYFQGKTHIISNRHVTTKIVQ